MKAAKMEIDLNNDTMEFLGRETNMVTTSSGYYCLTLTGDFEDVDLTNLIDEEMYKCMEKLHSQFGHHPSEKFIKLMKDARAYFPGAERHLEKIRRCEGCLIGGRNPDRPAVHRGGNAHGSRLLPSSATVQAPAGLSYFSFSPPHSLCNRPNKA